MSEWKNKQKPDNKERQQVPRGQANHPRPTLFSLGRCEWARTGRVFPS